MGLCNIEISGSKVKLKIKESNGIVYGKFCRICIFTAKQLQRCILNIANSMAVSTE